MSATSFKPLPTLRGLFDEPKMNHRRNFLLENKLSLREKQSKVVSREELEREKFEKQQKEIKQHQKFQESYERKRSSSQVNVGCYRGGRAGGSVDRNKDLHRQTSNVSSKTIEEKVASSNSKGGTYLVDYNKSQQNHHMTLATQRSRRSEHEAKQLEGCKKAALTARSQGSSIVKISNSSHSVSKQIQTEDIRDEEFLIEALQRCTANDLATLHDNRDNFVQKRDSDVNIHQTHEDIDGGSYHYEGHNPTIEKETMLDTGRQSSHNGLDNIVDNKSIASNRLNVSRGNGHLLAEGEDMKSLLSHRLNGGEANIENKSVHSHNLNEIGDAMNGISPSSQIHQISDYRLTDRSAVSDVYIGDSVTNGLQIVEKEQGQPPLTGRSRLSIISNSSRRIPHQLGSRENIRLPAYLEREKRETAAEHQKALLIDADCPPGHYLLSNEERQEVLKSTKTRFDTLVSELNRLPVTMDTIRVRTRRSAIEKELTVLENQILAFSKQKVYVKRDDVGCGDN